MKKLLNSIKSLFKADILMASTALIVSICALVVSFYEAGLMRKQHEDSVWPYIDVGTSYNKEGFRLHVSNKGVGPAIIKSFKIWLEEQPIEQWDGFIEKHYGDSIAYSCSSINGNVLSPNEEVRIVHVRNAEAAEQIWKEIQKFEIEIIYCSIHDECWKLHEEREKMNFKGETPKSLCF